LVTGQTVDAALEAFTVGAKIGKFLAAPPLYVTKLIIVEGLRQVGLVEGEVPDIPAIKAIAEVVPYGSIIFSAPTAYAPAPGQE